jgi:hypothetical protein
MTSTATAAFTLDKWDPQSSEEGTEGAQLSRVAIAKTLTGEVEGTSTVEMLTAVTETSRAYVAFERAGRSRPGPQGDVRPAPHRVGGRLRILPGLGNFELTGIAGTAEIIWTRQGSTPSSWTTTSIDTGP